MVDNRDRIADVLAAGVRYEIGQVTPENLDTELSRHLGPGDVCLDLAWNIDTCTILEWCRAHGVRYINTSMELWDPYESAATTHPLERTLYVRHMALRRMSAKVFRGAMKVLMMRCPSLSGGAASGLVAVRLTHPEAEPAPRVRPVVLGCRGGNAERLRGLRGG